MVHLEVITYYSLSSQERTWINFMKRYFAAVGSWGFGPELKGLSIYQFNPDTADMTLLSTDYEKASIGALRYAGNQVLYFTEERGEKEGQVGGGGTLYAVRIDPDGRMQEISRSDSLAAEPAYLAMDREERYLLAAHHADSGHVTQIVRAADGSLHAQAMLDDAALVLFQILPDGRIGKALDAVSHHGDVKDPDHAFSHLHSINASPDGHLFLACDAGLDRMDLYRIDDAAGRLVNIGTMHAEAGTAPRYAAFHPSGKWFFINHERRTEATAYSFDESGRMAQISSCSLMPEGYQFDAHGNKVEAADLTISRDGAHLYASVRGAETISVLSVDENGCISLQQIISSGGINPRGLCLSPDGKFLLAAHMQSGTVEALPVHADGSLGEARTVASGHCPGVICIIEKQEETEHE